MRSIAEYFRDLAADDRYFGAEPPTPDAEMLHRIAEKEIQRRVEARVEQHGIVLKQLADDDEPTLAKPATAFAPAFETDDNEEIETTARAADFPEVEDVAAVSRPIDEAPAESVAEKLSRIRAVVSSARAAEAAAEQPTQAEDDLLDEMRHIAEADETEFAGDATETDIAEALSVFDAVEDEDTGEAEAAVTDDAGLPETAEDAAEEAEEAVLDDAAEPAMDAIDEDEQMLSPAASEHEADEPADGALGDFEAVSHDSSYGQVVRLSGDDFEGREMASGEADDAIADEAEAWSPAAARAQDEDDETDDDDETDEVAWTAFDEDAELADEAEAASEDETEVAEDDEQTDWAAGSEVGMDDEDEASFDVRVEDVAETTDDMDADEVEDTATEAATEDDSLAADIRAALGQDYASGESEHDDEERLAAWTDEDYGDDEDDDDDDDEAWAWQDDSETAEEDEDVSAGAIAARERLGDLSEPDGDASDVDRLLEKTNSQLAETESSRRRSAIAHLKAAVAATKADRLLKRVTSRERSEAEEQTQYRDDLAQVVRPRRPAAETTEAGRERPKPLGEGKSPLMLVSELRVDDGELKGISPIRPRRIMHSDEADMAEADGSSYEDAANFAAFADKMGAKDLPDLLEAAAAYAAFVENRPHFSRPQLMKRVAKYDAKGEFTREAGLRSFGQLLRQGKIRKLKRGQFTVADSTRFNPEARIAGE
jgi:hypothetical protein